MELITAEEARNMREVSKEDKAMEYVMSCIEEKAVRQDYFTITDLTSTEEAEILNIIKGNKVLRAKLRNLGYAVTFGTFKYHGEVISRMLVNWGDSEVVPPQTITMVNSLGDELLPIGTMVKVTSTRSAVSGMTLEIIDYDNSVNDNYTDYYVLACDSGKRYLHYKDVQEVC